MKVVRLVLVLSAVNALLLVALLSQLNPAAAQQTAPVLRGRALEIVDAQGRPRATLHVEPAGAANGVAYQETVIFRLITERGRPAVKVTTSEEGSGVMVAAGTATERTYVTVGAKGTATTITMKNEDGRERLIAP